MLSQAMSFAFVPHSDNVVTQFLFTAQVLRVTTEFVSCCTQAWSCDVESTAICPTVHPAWAPGPALGSTRASCASNSSRSAFSDAALVLMLPI